jgi:alpha-glucosidase (family GH31 glycosyl hydrolase)
MMQNTFFRRLFYYLIGLGIGMIFVFFVFGNRGCSWLPQNKVKETINHKILLNASKKIQSSNIKKILEESEVDFDKSNKNTSFKTYFFESSESSYSFFVSYYADSYLAVIHDDLNQLNALKTDTFLKIVNLPDDKFSLFNFDVSQTLLNSLKSVNFTRENYSKVLLNNGFLSYNFNKNNNTEAEFLIKNNSDSTLLYFSWKDVMLTPIKVDPANKPKIE